MSGSFVAHERNDDERRNGDSLDRNENRIEPKQTSETPDRFIARKPEEAYDRQHGRWKILYFQFPDNYKNLKRNDL